MAIAALLVIIGCRDSALSATDDALQVAPASLEWPVTVVGRTSTRQLSVFNPSRNTRRLQVELDGDLFEAPAGLELEGGSTTMLEVTFAPMTEGLSSGELRLREGDRTITVPLSGEARLVTCPKVSFSCLTLTPDDDGRCVERPVADGTRCSERCLESGTCLAGACVGTTRVCADGNPCTSDRCSADRGCVFEPVECAAPANPCQVAICDRERGCVATDVKDGEPCGPNDCDQANVCIAGSCRQVRPPEGTSCGETSACQVAGTCRNNRCEQPPPTPLAPVWHIGASSHSTGAFTGVADSSGNLFWVFWGASGTSLVSVNRDGQPRFSVNIPLRPRQTEVPLFLISDFLVGVILTPNSVSNRIEVRSTRDGVPVWSKGHAELAPVVGLGSSTALWIAGAGTVGVPSRVWLNLRTVSNGGSDWRSWIMALDQETGATLWTVPAGYVSEAIADDDAIYFHDTSAGSLRAADTSGRERWVFVDEVGALSAVANGHLVTSWPALLRHTSTGEVHQRLDAGLRDSNLLTADQLVTQPTGLCRGSMVWLDRSTGGWSSWSAGCTTEPLVTSRGTVLVGKQTDVYELNRDGSVRWSCPLSPRASRVNGAAVLTGNRWVVGDSVGNIDAYDLPVSGLGRGWVTPHGSPARASRPMR